MVPAEFAGRSDDYVALVCSTMLEACAPYARWVDVFCEAGAFDAGQAAEVLRAGAGRSLRGRVHANQLGPGPGVRVAVEAGAASADHCTFLSAADVDALSASGTVATLLPGQSSRPARPMRMGAASSMPASLLLWRRTATLVPATRPASPGVSRWPRVKWG